MPKALFALEPDEEKRLRLEQKGIIKRTFTLYLDDRPLGDSFDDNALAKGVEYTLENGNTVSIKLGRAAGFMPEMQIRFNGKLIQGCAASPEQRFKAAYAVIFFVGGLSLAVGLISELFGIKELIEAGINIYAAFTGAVLIGIGVWAKLKKSRTALAIAFILLVIDMICQFKMLAEADSVHTPVTPFLMRFLILFFVFRGFRALTELKSRETGGVTMRGEKGEG